MAEWKAKPGDGVIYLERSSYTRTNYETVHQSRYRLGIVKSAFRDGRVKSINDVNGRQSVREVPPGMQTYGIPALRTLAPDRKAALVAEFGRQWKSGEPHAPDTRHTLEEWRPALKPYLG